MAVLCDSQIQEQIGIEPFSSNERREDIVSYGVSSYGYDVRVGTRFKIFTNTTSGGVAIVDPKAFTDDLFIKGKKKEKSSPSPSAYKADQVWLKNSKFRRETGNYK